MNRIAAVAVATSLLAAPLAAQEDAEGCKDHPLFNRFPGTYLAGCREIQFDLRKFPTGTMKEGAEVLPGVEVEGPVVWLDYYLQEGGTPPSGLQIQRNFENAAKKAGGTIEGSWPGWCKAMYDGEFMPQMGNGCTSFASTLKFAAKGKETWVFLQAGESDGHYLLTISEREAMKQEIAATAIADELAARGFVALYVNFDTGKATIRPDSAQTLDDAAAALQSAPQLQIEVGGHTDNTGTPEGNLKLSQERAQAVVAALVARGIPAARLSARGYGQTMPIADNRIDEGRAKNRRVELVRK